MTVNFTGIKNAGAMFIAMPEMNNTMNILSLQLTNDESGNDLDEFRKAIKKTGSPEKYTTAYEGAVSVNVSTTEPEEEYMSKKHRFYLNGSPLETNDKNLPVFSYLCKLTNKIQEKDPKEMGASVEYIQSSDFMNGSSIGYFIKQVFQANPKTDIFPMLNNIYKPSVAKAGAKIVNDAVNETMCDYFA